LSPAEEQQPPDTSLSGVGQEQPNCPGRMQSLPYDREIVGTVRGGPERAKHLQIDLVERLELVELFGLSYRDPAVLCLADRLPMIFLHPSQDAGLIVEVHL